MLDDLILDVGEYIFEHPGGTFVLEHLIGQDVSKYFYGGYALEASKGDQPFFHSNVSRAIVNTLIVARLNESAPTMNVVIKESYALNDSTEAYVLTAGQRTSRLHAPKSTDVSCIGRHYLIRSVNMPHVKRQYTLCQSLQQNVYDDLLQGV